MNMDVTVDNQDLLFDYATGALPEGPSLIVATQLAIGGDGRDEVAEIEAIGGALLGSLET